MQDASPCGPRYVIAGASGAGKTTLSRQLGARLGLPVVELDAIYWGPDWTPQEPEAARLALAVHLASEAWIVDGTYRRYWPLTWSKADTLIWLDYGRCRLLWQLLRRTLPRVITHETLWHGNVETWHGAFVADDNLFRHAWRTQPHLRKTIPAALLEPAYAHLKLVRLRSPRETRRWLASIGPTVRP